MNEEPEYPTTHYPKFVINLDSTGFGFRGGLVPSSLTGADKRCDAEFSDRDRDAVPWPSPTCDPGMP